jgi:hypothetical protein
MKQVMIESTIENKLRQKNSIFFSSSTVFLVIKSEENNISTELSLLNHFLLKRQIKRVEGRIEVFNLEGNKISSKDFSVDEPRVYSIDPLSDIDGDFIGSAYLFFNSTENLAVPFCAVTGTIRAENSVSAVHTYGRVLEQQELNTRLDLERTVESGWTLRDSSNVNSFAVFHNGREKSSLDIKVEVTNFAGTIKSFSFVKKVKAFGTVILQPKEHISDIKSFLSGRYGHAKVSVGGLRGVFPRLLCGNYSGKAPKFLISSDEIQFTHSNFDFDQMVQPDSKSFAGYFAQPFIPSPKCIVYPISSKKPISYGGQILPNRTLWAFSCKELKKLKVRCVEANEYLPSRIVSASVGCWPERTLESECSTGVFTSDRAKVSKHWDWGLLKPSIKDGFCYLTIHRLEFDGIATANNTMRLRIFDDYGLKTTHSIEVHDCVNLCVSDLLDDTSDCECLWYVLDNNPNLGQFFITSTFIPSDGSSGFVEHAF